MSEAIYIVDKHKSALWIAANSRLKISGGSILCSNQFPSPTTLLKAILDSEIKTVIFCWRKALLDINKSMIFGTKFMKLSESKNLVVLIPDYLGLETESLKIENCLLSMCHSYYVTNYNLYELYSKIFEKKPSGVLHDIPDLTAIGIVRDIPKQTKNSPSKIRLIWVGNSKWGKRQGAIDHKGFKEIMVPLKRYISINGDCCEISIIDSSQNLLPYFDVLRKIRESDILIQTSKSEGTGLSTLEAMALETSVLSTPVGVFNEIVPMDLEEYFISNDLAEIHSKIHRINLEESSGIFLNIWEKYLNIALSEKVKDFKIGSTSFKTQKVRIWITVETRIFWILRYLTFLKKKLINLINFQ
jgi:glycosyltransferase involved in cell wall biosynthesis